MKRLLAAVAVILSLTAAPSVSAAGAAQARPPDGVAEINLRRLVGDPAYAARMLPSIEANAAAARGDREAEIPVQTVRALALAGLRRDDEARAAVRRVIELGPAEPDSYPLLWAAAARIQDAPLMVDIFEGVSRNLAAHDRHWLFERLGLERVFMLSHALRQAGNEEQRYRLAELLVAMDWPGPGDPFSRDSFARTLIDHRLEQGRREDAVRLARSISTPELALPLLIVSRYDGLLGGEAPTALLARLITEYDRVSAAAVAASPDDLDLILRRSQFLRGAGREADALALLEPQLNAPPERYVEQDDLLWIANEAAYALLALGRGDDALAVMAPIVALDMEAVPELIGPSINYAEMLWEAGRPAEALAHAEALAPLAERFANAYGRMWIDAAAACALSTLGRDAEAAARRAAMAPRQDDNPAAMTRAHLCAGELDEAERLVISRLRSDDPGPMLTALQDYRSGGAASGGNALLYRRFIEIRSRPAVQAAIARVGRILNLPLARTYYGGF